MQLPRTSAQLLESVTGGLSVPPLAKAGTAVIAAGLLFDLAVHTVLHEIHKELHAGFPIGEHLAHLVVVIGMALVLAGIVADGIRAQRRHVRQEGTARHALR